MEIHEVLAAAGRKLREDFSELQANNPHAAERGSEAEGILRDFLKAKLPRRFDVGSGIVVGSGGEVSRQSDLIIYDAMNSPVYRTGSRLQILPRDNVAAVIEVKSKLNKEELKDAAAKIAAVKKIKATPVSGLDQPVTFSPIITTSILGCVFAFDSYTSLETLADNLKEINAEEEDSDNWIDLVVVLDKGCMGYALQTIYGESIGWLDGGCGDEFQVPSLYVQLVLTELGDQALNHFFVRLMSHLTFFRKISAVDFDALMRGTGVPTQMVSGYQYNLNRKLVPVEAGHQAGSFAFPKVRFNLYRVSTRRFSGQMCFLPWQDGAVITFSTHFHPGGLFSLLLERLNLKGHLVQCRYGGATIFTSSVLPLSEDKFIEVTKDFPGLISVRDSPDDKPPPINI
jgi:hypothetical protein